MEVASLEVSIRDFEPVKAALMAAADVLCVDDADAELTLARLTGRYATLATRLPLTEVRTDRLAALAARLAELVDGEGGG